jgi:hypothetical protein
MNSPTVFSSKTNNSKLGAINLENIDGVYVSLKQSDNINGGYKIENIEGMRDFDIKNFVNINQKIDQNALNDIRKQDLVLNDNIFTRVFIGGISFFGLYVLYSVLYKTKK